MKRFFKKLRLLSLLFGSAVLLFIFLIAILPPSIKSNNTNMDFFIKQEMLRNKHLQKQPSIVLLGGSNVAYGFNSEMLLDSLNMPVINTGFNADLGLKFMLDNISNYLMEGDMLVIAPEYHHFFNTQTYGKSTLAVLFYTDPSIGVDFDVKQFNAIIGNTGTAIHYLLIYSLSKSTNSVLNEYGDHVAHWNKQPQSYKHVSPGDFKTINMPFLDYYENAVAALRNRGVQVIIIPPSFAETSYKMIEERLIPLFSEFEKRDLSFAIPPQESAYPDSLFFDTHYHLGYEGVLIRTNQLIRAMKTGE
jgi:hypothetical protein